MDILHALLFYVSAVPTVGGALGVSLLVGRRRALSLAVFGLGLAILYADLNAAFAGVVALVAYLGSAALLVGTYASVPDAEEKSPRLVAQIAAVLAAVVFAVLVYVAFRGTYFANPYSGGGLIGAAAVGRLLLGRDPLALEAAAAGLLLAVIGFGVAGRLGVDRRATGPPSIPSRPGRRGR